MAGKCSVQALPVATVRLLGSTQVITSVFSVVKELVENALDADATVIDVKLEKGGLDKIEVRDNGCGIATEDIPLVAQHHCTSKITTHGDLGRLQTFGFRGEALASLCAVSEVSVTTKTAEAPVGQTYLFNSSGEVCSSKPSHLGQGTTVSVCNLLKSLPVRRQILMSTKRQREDLKKVEDLLSAFGAIFPKLRFSLHQNGAAVWQKVPTESVQTALSALIGRKVASQLLHQQKNQDEVKLDVYLPKPGTDVSAMSRSTADSAYIAVNQRPVAVPELDKVIRQYYHNCHGCETTRYPIYFLAVTLPADQLDVNLEPNKTRVLLQPMALVKEMLEDLLLYVYGPLDTPPVHWRQSSKQSAAVEDVQSADSACSLDKFSHRPGADAGAGRETVGNGDSSVSVKPSSSSLDNDVPTSRSTERNGLEIEIYSRGCDVESTSEDWNQACVSTLLPDLDLFMETSLETGLSENLFSENVQQGTCSEAAEQGARSGSALETRVTESGLAQESSERGDSISGGTMSLSATSLPGGSSNTFSKTSESSVTHSSNDASNVIPDCASSSSTLQAMEIGAISESASDPGENAASACQNDARNDPLAWTRGSGVVDALGSVIQPVTLLPPSENNRPGKRPLPVEPDEEPRSKVKAFPAKFVIQGKQSTFDLIRNQRVRRPETPFAFFCKDKRRQVVDENPEADYEGITEVLQELWQELSPPDRAKYESQHRKDVERYEAETAAASKKQSKSLKSALSKAPVSVRDQLAGMVKRQSPMPADIPVLETEFSLQQIKARISQGQLPSAGADAAWSLVGPLGRGGAWLCKEGDRLLAINPHRLAEVLLYRQLRNSHSVPASSLTLPCPLFSTLNEKCWEALKMLTVGQTGCVDLTDSRLVKNGFLVRCHITPEAAEGEQFTVQLTGLSPHVNKKDLVPILESMHATGNTLTLADSRPQAVLHYLEGEAVRMTRQTPLQRSRSDVEELLQQLQQQCSISSKLPTDLTCLHGQSVFLPLDVDLESASPSHGPL